MSKKRLVVANWKMYIESPEAAKKLAGALRKKSRAFSGVEVVVAPPYPFIPVVAAVLKGSALHVGAQALFAHDEALHTGDVSAAMIKNAGASFVIVGHSERRALGEDNATVRKQFGHALSAGLTAVLCIGEAERNPEGTHFATITEQLATAFAGVQSFFNRIVIAYEPVWAIGKSADEAMKPQELEEMVIFIRKTLADILDRTVALKIPILYGGSVEESNAAHLLKEGSVSGFLVGHASTEADSFIEILKQCKK